MSMWRPVLVIRGSESAKARGLGFGKERRILFDQPCCGVQAMGIGGVSHDQYDLEWEQVAMSEAATAAMRPVLVLDGSHENYRRRIPFSSPCQTVTTMNISGCQDHWIEYEPGELQVDPTEKPPYRVPTMQEVCETPWNGFNAISTFSGCGGSCLGYRMAGFRVLWASEFVEAAQETYRANHPSSFLNVKDIREVSAEQVLAEINEHHGLQLGVGDIDLMDGSPPCASFSTVGKREADWGKVKPYSDTKQRTDDLFFEYARLVEGLQPKTFVAENVSGLVKGSAKGYFKIILRRLKDCGYRVTCRVLDAQWLGVPQQRARTIFVGVREDLGLDPVHPSPLPYRYTLGEVLPWIVKAVHNTHGQPQFSTGEFTHKPAPAITVGPNAANSAHYEAWVPSDEIPDEAKIDRFEIGKEWDKLRPGESSERFMSLVKPSPDKPCPTVTQTGGSPSAAGVVHPLEKRKFTIPELRRICAFPDDFVLTGDYRRQWERLGRAVPPLMMRAIAECVRDGVLRRCAG